MSASVLQSGAAEVSRVGKEVKLVVVEDFVKYFVLLRLVIFIFSHWFSGCLYFRIYLCQIVCSV